MVWGSAEATSFGDKHEEAGAPKKSFIGDQWKEELMGLKGHLKSGEQWAVFIKICLNSIYNHISLKKQESSRKTSISALLTMPIDYAKAFLWITINCGKFWKRWAHQTTWPASWEICMQVRKQQLELDMNYRLLPNRKRSTSRLYIVTLLI